MWTGAASLGWAEPPGGVHEVSAEARCLDYPGAVLGSALLAVLLVGPAAADGPVISEVVFRHQRKPDRGVFKLTGALGWHSYQGLVAPLAEHRCGRPTRCLRVGHQILASTLNIRDPVVVELRFHRDGSLMEVAEDPGLYHSLRANRQWGHGRLEDGRLTITGAAAVGIRDYVGQPGGDPVILDLVDLASGAWEAVWTP